MLEVYAVDALGDHPRALRAEVAVEDARLHLVVFEHLQGAREMSNG